MRNPADGSPLVIPERHLHRIRDLKGAPAFVTIPDNAIGVSGLTAAKRSTGIPIMRLTELSWNTETNRLFVT